MTKLGFPFESLTVRLVLVIATALAAFLPAASGDVAVPGSNAFVPVAAASDEFELGPAPQVTDSAELAPRIARDASVGTTAIQTSNRQDVVNAYNTIYLPALAVPAGWTGSIAGCVPGTTSAAYETATLQLVNYFRGMAGLPGNIVFNPTFSAKSRDAALMMIAQGQLSHFPPTSFACYTANGAEAAGNSNLALGIHGPNSIRGYIDDPGASNNVVGHRRWILYPPQVAMGTGSTTGVNGFFTGSNALWILGPMGQRPLSPEFVAWPPPGFVPHQIAFDRWSFSYDNADFSSTSITVSRAGSPISLNIQPIQNGFGDNTIVWEPQGITRANGMPDTTYTVTLNNVRVGGVPRTFSYNATIIDPASTAPAPTPTRTSTPPTGGAPTATPTPPPTGAIGGRGFAISPSTGGTNMTWLAGTAQTGYAIGFFLPTGTTLGPSTGVLPASATSHFDARAFSGTTCYVLLPIGGSGALGLSDLLCWLANSRTPTGAPQNFTMRLNQSNTATFTWSGPLGGGQDNYQLLPLGGSPINIPGGAVSASHTMTGPTCYALIARQSTTALGFTDVLCGFPGVATV